MRLRLQTTLLVALATLFTLPVIAQNIQLKGTVTDQDNAPIPGAGILIKGTSKGTTTDFDGNFTLSISLPITLKISYLGFKSQEINVTTNSPISVQLESEDVMLEDIVVIGSRNANRTVTETAVPVDVLNLDEVTNSVGQVDVSQLLQFAVPSFNANQNAGSDGSDHIQAASLRGLGPDQVLVLINGKRRHTASLLNMYGTRERGKVATDLSTIPASAIERIEVLRDGASAQYGSDAIAGVINIVLKKQTETTSINASAGIHQEGDGETYMVGSNFGFGLGEDGYLNVTAQINGKKRTNRAPDYEEMRRIGTAASNNASLFLNAGKNISENTEIYAFGGASIRQGEADAWGRGADDARNIPQIYPEGFVPVISTDLSDFSFAVGVKSKMGNWDVDLSNVFGYNKMMFDLSNTLNTSQAANAIEANETALTSFDAGGFSFGQNVTNLNVSRFFPDVANGFSLAFGTEYRVDLYNIYEGERWSWDRIERNGLAGGSQGFPGYRPENEVNASRSNIGAYIDTELDITDKWMVGAAVRGENYSDFGGTFTGKVSSRYAFTDNLAFRGSASTGFRAPSIHQANYSSTFTDFTPNESGDLVATEVVLSKNDSELAKLLGIPELKEETSKNYSLGMTISPAEGLTVTVDGYLIDIEDRVVMTGYFDSNDLSADVAAIMNDMGVSQAAFFTNAIDTRTKGLDLVASYNKSFGEHNFMLTAGANYNKTEVVGDVKTSAELEGMDETYFGEKERYYLEGSAPEWKGNLTLNYNHQKLSAMARVNYFGEVVMGTWSSGGLLQVYSPKAATDLSVSYKLLDNLTTTVGGSNIFNVYPDKQNPDETDTGGYWEGVQMGFNGAYYYTRITFNF
ncbi:TonB-dependent receptor [Limibacter armeniacum]|uniref:TonB-dependent receptor n=1 Tax=Limibacter armeniacum TaxID=466084 RepID=UPI002FE63C3D